MKLHIMSDLHLEFSNHEPPATGAEVVVLAGDIHKGVRGIHWASETFAGKHIVFVPGNHEFYGVQRLNMLAEMRVEAQKCGVHLLDEDELVIEADGESVRFLGATLWTDFDLHGEKTRPMAMCEGSRFLNDFRVIHEGARGHFSPQHSIELHKVSRAWLEKKLAEPFEGQTIVITHHLPSKKSVATRYKNALLSACFASNLDHLFGKMALWVHGHTHDNFDYQVGATRVVCNPRGYVTYQRTENVDFEPGLVVEI